MSRILIRNGHLVDPANGIDRPGDLAIADGRVLAAARVSLAMLPV